MPIDKVIIEINAKEYRTRVFCGEEVLSDRKHFRTAEGSVAAQKGDLADDIEGGDLLDALRGADLSSYEIMAFLGEQES